MRGGSDAISLRVEVVIRNPAKEFSDAARTSLPQTDAAHLLLKKQAVWASDGDFILRDGDGEFTRKREGQGWHGEHYLDTVGLKSAVRNEGKSRGYTLFSGLLKQ